MNIFKRLECMELTTSEQALVDYICQNYQTMIKMNLDQLSKASFVSSSTIYRLCQKLELSGLSELKALVIADIDDYLKGIEPIDYNYPFKQNETGHSVVLKMEELYQKTIIESANLSQKNQLYTIARELKTADHIDFYTSAGNIYFAENFKFQMQEIGTFVNVPFEIYHLKLTASTSNAHHIAIMVSYEGRGFSFNDIVHILKRNKTKIILISSTNDNPLIKFADYVLFLNSHENHFNKISSFSSRLSLLYLLDCIYTCYFNLDYEKNINYKLNTYKKLSAKY